MASTQVITKKVGPCGGGGGQVKDMNVDGITRILKISIRHGLAIDAFTVRYLRSCCGVDKEESTELWGGKGGNLQEFVLQPTEYITSVKGHYGNFNGMVVLRSLKFKTSSGTTFGPYGKKEGIPFELHAITGQIVGFHARSGKHLDAIGVYVKANKMTGGSNGGGNTGSSTGTGIGSSFMQSVSNLLDHPASNAMI